MFFYLGNYNFFCRASPLATCSIPSPLCYSSSTVWLLSNIHQRYICTCIHTYIHVCTYTRTCTHIHRPKTDLGTGELKTEEPSTPRRSARLLAKRSQKESPLPPPAENSSGGSARKKNLSAASVNKEEETASLAPRLRSRLRSGEKSNQGEQSTSEPSATEGTTRAESLRGRRKSPANRTAAVNKSPVSTTRVPSPQKKDTKETVDTSEPDRTSRSGRKGKRSSSAALLSTSPPPKRQKSTSKASPRAASVRNSRKKQESDVDSQLPGSSRGAQRGKNSQANKTRKTRPVAESTDSEPEFSKTRKGKSPAKLKSSPLLTAKEKLEGKASAKGKSRASSSKGKGKAGSAATAKRAVCVCGGGGA